MKIIAVNASLKAAFAASPRPKWKSIASATNPAAPAIKPSVLSFPFEIGERSGRYQLMASKDPMRSASSE